jgi:hypothetical protein
MNYVVTSESGMYIETNDIHEVPRLVIHALNVESSTKPEPRLTVWESNYPEPAKRTPAYEWVLQYLASMRSQLEILKSTARDMPDYSGVGYLLYTMDDSDLFGLFPVMVTTLRLYGGVKGVELSLSGPENTGATIVLSPDNQRTLIRVLEHTSKAKSGG